VAESLRAIAVLYAPVMPGICEELWQSLGAAETAGALADQNVRQVADWGVLRPGATITKTPPLFPRLEEDKA